MQTAHFCLSHPDQINFIMNALHSSHVGGVWCGRDRSEQEGMYFGPIFHPHVKDWMMPVSIVDSRLLTVDSLNDADGPEPLTPNHIP